MYSLLLVDDETTILDGLYHNIAWEESGFSDVYRADDAETALDILNRNRIDVVVTDISMPGMNGIDLCERIHESWPLCRIIMLTGVREFDYACRAVELGVYQYLVKPVRYEDLQNIVSGALDELKNELEQRRMMEHVQTRLREMGEVMRDRVLDGWLIQGSVSPANDYEMMREAGVSVRADMRGFCLALRWAADAGSPAIALGVQEIAEKILCGRQMYCIPTRRGEILLVMLCESEKDAVAFRQRCLSRLDVVQVSVEKSMGFVVSAYVGRVATAEQMERVCAPLLSAARRRSAAQGAILVLDDEYDSEALLWDGRMADAFASLDMTILQKWLNDCLSPLPGRDEHRWQQRVLTALMAAMTGDCVGRGMDFEDLQPLSAGLMECSGLAAEELTRRCMELAGRYAREIAEKGESQRRQLSNEVRELISSRMETGITVNAIAEQLHYNSNYLSHLMKLETGQSLEDLLISMRIERACRLLKDGIRVQEVALKVGYDNLAHFSRLFKRKMGVSPRQYVI